MTHIHLVVLTIYLLAVGAIASTWWRTRATWTWYALAILAAPLLGALWVLTLSSEGAPSEQEESPSDGPSGLAEDTDPRTPPPIKLDHHREETLDDLLAEEPDDPDHPDDLGAALDEWARSRGE